jgi:hypothetical protein
MPVRDTPSLLFLLFILMCRAQGTTARSLYPACGCDTLVMARRRRGAGIATHG